ncbi:hypothetical protein DPMN_133484 [Dreissena polymorpha]|uniref:Uncharacterized protein n=1 Tax=Dreissena polymorpha TaxID=45954 RepID=A0A9D4JE14_DREPO|nr:hypothetical protein DPMN_133484 [Dreissena polymorpha]
MVAEILLEDEIQHEQEPSTEDSVPEDCDFDFYHRQELAWLQNRAYKLMMDLVDHD